MSKNIKDLEKIELENDIPSIEAETEYVSISIGSFDNPINFVDRDGYKSKYAQEETVFISKIVLFQLKLGKNN
jgi:hypothetical protein